MKNILTVCFLLFPLIAWSNPAPFGLKIGEATIKNVKEKYSIERIGLNKYSKGEMYDVDMTSINFDGMTKMTLVFSRKGTLLAILTTLPKKKFQKIYTYLDSKYDLVSKTVPFVGNKTAKFVSGETEITLDAPHMSFQMKMNYINKGLLQAYKVQSNKEKQIKQQSEQNQL